MAKCKKTQTKKQAATHPKASLLLFFFLSFIDIKSKSFEVLICTLRMKSKLFKSASEILGILV